MATPGEGRTRSGATAASNPDNRIARPGRRCPCPGFRAPDPWPSAFRPPPPTEQCSVPTRPPLLQTDDRGLACRLGGFHIDPWAPVPLAVITHAHGDHARGGCGRYLCAVEGIALLGRRLPPGSIIEGVPFGERVPLGDVIVSFHPAGHIRGSAQIRVESADEVWVASGDYKRQPDPTCSAFEPVPCDVFITEATFALPIYRWRPTRAVVAEIAGWWRLNRGSGRASVLFGYALGKTQRILAELSVLAADEEWAWMRDAVVFEHGAVAPLTRVYRAEGVALLGTASVAETDEAAAPCPIDAPPPPDSSVLPVPSIPPEPAAPAGRGRRSRRRADFAGALVVAPPSAAGTPWMRRFGADAQTGFASGWMQVRGVRRRRGYDRGFVISDHADWFDLLRTVRETGARRVLVTHGNSAVLSRYLNGIGIDAAPLATPFASEDAE